MPSLSYDHPAYQPEGAYWRGSVWAPTTYMVLRGLDRNGYFKQAHDIACNTVKNVVKVFAETGTLWENYAPEKAAHGNCAKADFVGWTGLVPISMLIEYVFGIRCSAPDKTVTWDIRLDGAYGVRNLSFANVTASFLHNADGSVEIKTNHPITVKLVKDGKTDIRTCKPL